MQNKIIKRLMIWAGAVIALLLILLISKGWFWKPFDFIWVFVKLFGAALIYELVSRKIPVGTYRAAVAVAVITGLLLVFGHWHISLVEGPVNLLYAILPIIVFIRATAASFQPRKMAYILFTTALAQLLMPIIIFLVCRYQIYWVSGNWYVFGFNAVFALFWIVSGLLFRRVVVRFT